MKIDRCGRVAIRWLASGSKGAWRRGVFQRLRRYATMFYTVQSPASAERLRTNGRPWPTGEIRAHLGSGVYSWATRSEAIDYLQLKRGKGHDVVIVRFWITNWALQRFRHLDID